MALASGVAVEAIMNSRYDTDEMRNVHAQRIERLVCGALKSTIAAHGPITPILIGSAAKRIVGQLLATGQGRIAVPVMTAAQLERLERLADRFDALQSEMMDGSLQDLTCSLSVLRGENHPEGWAVIETIEHGKTPLAVVHHWTVGKAPKQYQRKRDGKTVELSSAPVVPEEA